MYSTHTFWIEQLQFNSQELIPAIAQDYEDGAVLMMAWMNRESIQRTLETGEAHYWR
jgi:phosphoribosyl-AMP cyclohydrolase